MANLKSIDLKATLHRFGWIPLVVLLALSTTAAPAQEAEDVTMRQLQQELARRDAVIVDLLNRVRALEQSLSASNPASVAGSRADEAMPSSAAGGVADEGPPASAAAGRAGAGAGQGDFEIDELQAQRALERGLVQEGARVLEPGQIEFAPAFAVSRQDGMFPVALMRGDETLVGEVGRTYDVFERRADFRFGLPWSSQLEIGLPYLTVDQQIETGIDGAVQSATTESGSGFGDAAIGFSKVLAEEKASRPNLIGRLVWLTGSGDEQDGAVALGGGHRGVATRLSAYWRRDPAVFLIGGGYTRYADDPGLKPGDRFDVSLGLGLAVSPETALVFSLNQTWADEFEQDGRKLPGTDRLASTLDLSVSTIIGRRLFLRGYTAAGLTEDSPDYRFEISLSSVFDMR